MEKRIYSKVTHTDQSEREYYHKKAKELGYSTFVDFAKAAMQKVIEEEDYVVNQLTKIAEESADLWQILDIQAETQDLNAEELQARNVAELIYDLSVHTDAMINSPQNQVRVTDLVYLEGEAPRVQYKYPLMAGFDVNKYIQNPPI